MFQNEKIDNFINHYKNTLNMILEDYAKENNNIQPLIENSTLIAPHDSYKMPKLKLIIGFPMSYNKRDKIPFLKIKEDKNNHLLNKVTDEDLNRYLKIKISYHLAVEFENYLNGQNVLFYVEKGKSWIDKDEKIEVCYLYLKGALSFSGKKKMIKLLGGINNESANIVKTESNINKKELNLGEQVINVKLEKFDVEQRKINDSKSEKRYVGYFYDNKGNKYKGTIPKKIIEINGEINNLLGKEISFKANLRDGIYFNYQLFSNPRPIKL